MIDESGETVTLYREHGNYFKNTHDVCYIRADVLKKYCQENNKKLIWTIWGERQIDREPYGRDEEIMDIYHNHSHCYRTIIEY